MRHRKDLLLALLAVGVALLVARAALPYIVRDYVNGRLSALDHYDGSVGDVDIGLWRGAYSIDRVEIVRAGDGATPFFTSDRVDFSVQWRSLLGGSLVSEAVFLAPRLNLVRSRRPGKSQLGVGESWYTRLEEMFPFRFDTLEVVDGIVTFRAPGIDTRDALTARHVNGVVKNLTNVAESGQRTFAEFQLAGDVLGEAPLAIEGSLEPFADLATFDLNLSLKGVAVPRVNPWLREYLKADAERGRFDLYLELASADGRYEGYAKPLLHDVEFFGLEEDQRNPLQKLWEGAVDLAAEALENQPQEQVAAKIPIRGTIRGRQSNLVATIASLLGNAFVRALSHSIDHSVTLEDVS